MEVRYSGRTVNFDVTVFNAAEFSVDRLNTIAERIKRAVAGERIDMTALAASRSNGVARFNAFVNTDCADDQLRVLVERIKQVARAEKLDIIVAASRIEPENAAPIWRMLIEGAVGEKP
jgi:hypothetical protein